MPVKYQQRTVTDSLGGRDQRNGRFANRIRFFAGSRPGFDKTVCSGIVCTSSRRELYRPKAGCGNEDIDNIVNLCRGP